MFTKSLSSKFLEIRQKGKISICHPVDMNGRKDRKMGNPPRWIQWTQLPSMLPHISLFHFVGHKKHHATDINNNKHCGVLFLASGTAFAMSNRLAFSASGSHQHRLCKSVALMFFTWFSLCARIFHLCARMLRLTSSICFLVPLFLFAGPTQSLTESHRDPNGMRRKLEKFSRA